jgi:hypothetical protein
MIMSDRQPPDPDLVDNDESARPTAPADAHQLADNQADVAAMDDDGYEFL